MARMTIAMLFLLADLSMSLITPAGGSGRQGPKLRSAARAPAPPSSSAKTACPTDKEIESAVNSNELLSRIMQPETHNTMRIRPSCLKNAMESSGFMKQLVRCDQTGKEIVPCEMKEVSHQYLSLVERSLSTVFYCTKDLFVWNTEGAGRDIQQRSKAPAAENLPIDDAWSRKHVPKTELLFAMLQTESGLHVGIRSHTGALGAGQLTQAAREHISKNLRRSYGPELSKLQQSKHPACQELGKRMSRQEGLIESGCDAVSLAKGNPAMNLLYSFVNVAANERHLRTVFMNPGPKLSFLMGKMSPDEKEEFIFGLAVWAHNTGVGGLSQAITTLERSPQIEPLDKLKGYFQEKNIRPDALSLDQRFETIEQLLSQLCKTEPQYCDYPSEGAQTPPKGLASKAGVEGIKQALGWNHLLLYAADRIKDPNRHREVMGYLPKIKEKVTQNQNQRCVGYYERGITGIHSQAKQ